MLEVTYEGCGVAEVEAVYPEHGDGGPHGARHQQHRQGDRRVGPPAGVESAILGDAENKEPPYQLSIWGTPSQMALLVSR